MSMKTKYCSSLVTAVVFTAVVMLLCAVRSTVGVSGVVIQTAAITDQFVGAMN